MKVSSALAIVAGSLILVGPLSAETATTRLTPANLKDQPLSFTIQVERIKDRVRGERLHFRVTLKPQAGRGVLAPTRSAQLQVLDGDKLLIESAVEPTEGRGQVTYTFPVVAKYVEKSRFIMTESFGEFSHIYYWFHLHDFAQGK